MKPGVKTTEFAFAVAFTALNVAMLAAGMLDPKWALLAQSAVTLGYQVLRTIAKANGIEPPKDDKPGLKP
jgi:hypothetical protein